MLLLVEGRSILPLYVGHYTLISTDQEGNIFHTNKYQGSEALIGSGSISIEYLAKLFIQPLVTKV